MSGEDNDLVFAMFLQEQFNNEGSDTCREKDKIPASLVDDAWEMIDPAPDIRQLFLQFNDEYFDGLLGGVEVRWSPRMTLCAGLCCYEGRGGLCSIRLSEPLLKLRPRKDLVQTLLHEMIHALLFVTQNNKDHDGHGPEFHKHMYRINNKSGTNITVYHNFHDEVNSYRLHWWKCNGPCQKWSPFYGVVKRAMNRAPAPRDTWWDDHQRKCGGEFTKIKEPENYGKKKPSSKAQSKAKYSGIGSSKEKGKILGSGALNLPTFFDKMKKNNVTADVSSQLKKDSREIQENTEVDGDSCDERNPAKKQRTECDMPFHGAGHVLGSLKSAENCEFVRNHSSIIGAGAHSSDTKKVKSSSSQKTLSTEKGNRTKSRKKPTDITNKPELTIVDAFKRKHPEQCSSTLDALQQEGSKSNPIHLLEEDSSSLLPSPSTVSSTCSVSCPVCLIVVPISQVNAHLDNCLTTI